MCRRSRTGPNYFRFRAESRHRFPVASAFQPDRQPHPALVEQLRRQVAQQLQIGRARLSTELSSRCSPARRCLLARGLSQGAASPVGLQLADGTTSRPLLLIRWRGRPRMAIWGAAFGRYGELRIGPPRRVKHFARIFAAAADGHQVDRLRLSRQCGDYWRDAAAFARAGYRVEASLFAVMASFGAGTFSAPPVIIRITPHLRRQYGGPRSQVPVACTAKAPSACPTSGAVAAAVRTARLKMRGGQVALARTMAFRRVGSMPAFGRGICVGGSLEVGRII